MRQGNVGPIYLDVFGHTEIAGCRVAHHWFTRCFPAAVAGGRVTPDELYGEDAKQFRSGASFGIIKNFANVLYE